ncbi:MAG TPA: DinB family protein [Anaerolineales bacterium]|nr:DinB family protein [Anaerolineales bacterium]
MADNILVKFFEHNNWANLRIIQACSLLSDDQLDAEPQSATKGSIRGTLTHLVSSQRGYLALLTLPVDERPRTPLAFTELQESLATSGEDLVTLVRDQPGILPDRLQTTDGYYVEPWVVLLQVINHATEHREQIKSMLSALGETPPDIDGWDYGEVTRALLPMST